MENSFKPGDQVEVVEPVAGRGYLSEHIITGAQFIVKEVDNDMVTLENMLVPGTEAVSFWFLQSRFKKC